MPKPFDSATKQLIEFDPQAWLDAAGLPGTVVELIDADLSSVTSEADRFVRVASPNCLAHIELQSSYDATMGGRILRYNVLGTVKFGLPVQSVVFLLRPEADGPSLSGRVEYRIDGSDDCFLTFGYRVVRVWELSAAELLRGALGTLPLALVSDIDVADLPAAVERMETRLHEEAEPGERKTLWTTAYLLMGLKYPKEFAAQLLRGVQELKESVTYQAILEEGELKGVLKGQAKGKIEGKIEGERKMLLLAGEKRFGAPDGSVLAALDGIDSPSRFEGLMSRLFEVESWQELVA